MPIVVHDGHSVVSVKVSSSALIVSDSSVLTARDISTFAYLITSGRDVTASSRLMPTYCTQTTHGWREREAGRGRSQGDLKIII